MRVLTIYAHHDRRSFCHSVLEQFTAGLEVAGHHSEVVDLYAIDFDPVFRQRDVASYIDDKIPLPVLERMNLRDQVLAGCRGPLQRRLAARAMRDKTLPELAALIRARMPADARAQQKKVADADALAFIAPIHFCNFPAILRGWIERVFTYGFAYNLTEAAWSGDVDGRLPLLTHRRALLMTPTLFDVRAYDDGIRDAMNKVISDWGLRYPGITDVEHVYFYTAAAGAPHLIDRYLQHAFELGRSFDTPAARRPRLDGHVTVSEPREG